MERGVFRRERPRGACCCADPALLRGSPGHAAADTGAVAAAPGYPRAACQLRHDVTRTGDVRCEAAFQQRGRGAGMKMKPARLSLAEAGARRGLNSGRGEHDTTYEYKANHKVSSAPPSRLPPRPLGFHSSSIVTMAAVNQVVFHPYLNQTVRASASHGQLCQLISTAEGCARAD